MLPRKPVFPHVIEINCQAGQVLGCNVYLIYDDSDWLLIDIGYEETVDQIVEIIRQLDFPCQSARRSWPLTPTWTTFRGCPGPSNC